MTNLLDIKRSRSVYCPNKDHPPIHIIGVGATGSHIWDSLASLGYQDMTCYDFDAVEEHNLNNQTYLDKHVGIQKIEALKDLTLMKHPSIEYNYVNTKVTPADVKNMEGIIILSVDTMSARKELGEAIRDNRNVIFFSESRIASRHCNVYNFPNAAYLDWAEWFSTLMDDDDSRLETSACGGSISVKPTIMMAAAYVTWGVLDWINETAYELGINAFVSPPDVGKYVPTIPKSIKPKWGIPTTGLHITQQANTNGQIPGNRQRVTFEHQRLRADMQSTTNELEQALMAERPNE